jgi:hypothetical protein
MSKRGWRASRRTTTCRSTSSRKLATGGKAYRVSNLHFRNALVFDGSGSSPVVSDVMVEGGRIRAVGRELAGPRRKSSMRTGSR